MANTYTLIGTVTAGAATSTIEWSSIPNTYQDLVIHLSFRNGGNNGGFFMRLNNDAGNNYYMFRIVGSNYSGGTPSNDQATRSSMFNIMTPGNAATGFSAGYIYLTNYADTTKNKNVWGETLWEVATAASYAGAGIQQMTAHNWASNSAISTITLTSEDAGANFAQYSIASLYGIAKS